MVSRTATRYRTLAWAVRSRCCFLALSLSSCGAFRLGPPKITAPKKPAPKKLSCTSGAFGSTPHLQGVQTLGTNTRPLNFTGFRHGGQQGLLVDPPHHLAFCTIEKNGCSAWLVLLNRVMKGNSTIHKAHYNIVHRYWSTAKAYQVFKDPHSVRALWIRDPLERFLSGFLNKCMVPGKAMDFITNCPFRWPQRELGFPLNQVQLWLRKYGAAAMQNPHFTPQSTHCELKTRLHEYNVIGLMTSRTFAKNAGCILELAGLSHWNWGAKGDTFFDDLAIANMAGLKVGGDDDHEGILKKFFTKEFAQELLEVFKDDYDLFRLQRPAWVDKATGEWFWKSAPEVKGVKMSRSTDDSMPGYADGGIGAGEDDIVALAERAGFSLRA